MWQQKGCDDGTLDTEGKGVWGVSGVARRKKAPGLWFRSALDPKLLARKHPCTPVAWAIYMVGASPIACG